MLHTAGLMIFLVSWFATVGQVVLPGDYPDPSVVRINNEYWATATTSNWGPAFPLLKSDDLINWENKGYVFPRLPEWADYYFWAPEISYEHGKVYVYYSAHKKGGNLCLGVASADDPSGPYRDHGPIMCQPAGSIDAFPVRDKNGKLYLIWKEDGNSIGKPTPIWIMEMKEDRSGLIGEKKELFRNDAKWEGNLVEGVSIIQHGDYYYAFYAAAACCGRGCSYASGVARAKDLLGPWEKYSKNPVLSEDEEWKCPGHGTPVEKDGKYYFLYHAYNKKSDVYAGRQGLLQEFKFTDDGWIEFVESPRDVDVAIPKMLQDEFNGDSLSYHWQWPVPQPPRYNLADGELSLYAHPGRSGAFLGQKTYQLDYKVSVVLSAKESEAEGGLAVIGDEKNMVSITVKDGRIKIGMLEGDKERYLPEKNVSLKGNVHLAIKVTNGKDIAFSYSNDGKRFIALTDTVVDGYFLPPWDRAVRVGVIARGQTGQKAVFDKFVITHP